MKTFYITVSDEVGDAIVADAKEAEIAIAEFILEGLSAGISHGYPANRCWEALCTGTATNA